MSTYSDISGSIYTNLAGYRALYEVCSWKEPVPNSWFPPPGDVERALKLEKERPIVELPNVEIDGETRVPVMWSLDEYEVEVFGRDEGRVLIEFCDHYKNLTNCIGRGIEALIEADPEADIDVMDTCTDGMKTADKWATENGKLIHQSVR
jgi:hypothetical protein